LKAEGNSNRAQQCHAVLALRKLLSPPGVPSWLQACPEVVKLKD